MELFKNLKEFVSLIKRPLSNVALEFAIDYQSSKLKDYFDQINSIKTLYQPEKKVEVDKVYYPVSIECKGKINKVIHSQDLFSHDNCVLIEGTAGHGKSLLMRHIAVHEIKHGARVPVFILLRDKESNVKLTELICSELKLLGFESPDKALVYLLRNRRILIILDGFDEVKSDSRKSLLIEIEYLARKFKRPNIIISSRPNLEVRLSSYFSVVSLVDLNKKEQLDFIRHMTAGEEKLELIESFENNNFVSGVTKTPLLLVLLIIAYRAESRIPENLTEFYRMIFSTLLYRHDDMKIGYNRERRSLLGNYELQNVFESLSYLTLASNQVRFNESFFNEKIKKSAELTGHLNISNCEIDFIKHDIVHITCLIVEDGFDSYSYIHKSIQEYFASLYIIGLGEVVVEKFFNHLLKDGSGIFEWSQVINFISETNRFIFIKFFALKVLDMYFSKDLRKITINGFKRLIGDESIVTVDDDGEEPYVSLGSSFLYFVSPDALNLISDSIEKFLTAKSIQFVEYLDECELSKYDKIHASTSENNINLKEFLEDKGLWSEALLYLNSSDYYHVRKYIDHFKEYLINHSKKETDFLAIIQD